MMLMLGFIALRLLRAAVMSLVCLLLAPAAVLAPTLGESGRAVFRMWATRLLGAVISKLVFSFLLGAVLETERALSSVRAFGWLDAVGVDLGDVVDRRSSIATRRSASPTASAAEPSTARSPIEHERRWIRLARSCDTPVRSGASWLARAPSVEQRQRLRQAGSERADEIAEAQVGRTLAHDLGQSRARVQAVRRRRRGCRGCVSSSRACVARASEPPPMGDTRRGG